MILECTECQMRYLVADTAIGSAGRTVRCANCRHSWYQPPLLLDGGAGSTGSEGPAAARRTAPEPSIDTGEGERTAAPARRASAPASADAAVAPPVSRRFVDPEAERAERPPSVDAFAHQPPFRARRNPAGRWTAAAVAAGVVMLAASGAILYTQSPIIASQIGIGQPESPLLLSSTAPERRQVPGGNELFAISGQVVNPTGSRQRVPDIKAELHDAGGRVVDSWTIRPDVRSIGPSGKLMFHSAKLNVPADSRMLELSFAGGI